MCLSYLETTNNSLNTREVGRRGSEGRVETESYDQPRVLSLELLPKKGLRQSGLPRALYSPSPTLSRPDPVTFSRTYTVRPAGGRVEEGPCHYG